MNAVLWSRPDIRSSAKAVNVSRTDMSEALLISGVIKLYGMSECSFVLNRGDVWGPASNMNLNEVSE